MKTILILAVALSPSAAFGAQSHASAADDGKRIVCIKELEIGSRVARKRVCKTAAQWKQDRLEAREMLERSHSKQTNPSG